MQTLNLTRAPEKQVKRMLLAASLSASLALLAPAALADGKHRRHHDHVTSMKIHNYGHNRHHVERKHRRHGHHSPRHRYDHHFGHQQRRHHRRHRHGLHHRYRGYRDGYYGHGPRHRYGHHYGHHYGHRSGVSLHYGSNGNYSALLGGLAIGAIIADSHHDRRHRDKRDSRPSAHHQGVQRHSQHSRKHARNNRAGEQHRVAHDTARHRSPHGQRHNKHWQW